jgi:hypothetical protein
LVQQTPRRGHRHLLDRQPGSLPGGDAAIQIAAEIVIADAHQLANRFRAIGQAVCDQDQRAEAPPTSPGDQQGAKQIP